LYYFYIAVSWAFNIYYIMIIAAVLLTWLPISHSNPIVRFIYDMTEPFLNIFRKLVPLRWRVPLDFTPILALFALAVLNNLVLYLIAQLM